MPNEPYERRLSAWRTHESLAKPQSDQATMRRYCEALSDEELLVAAGNPDHCEVARVMAREAATARGLASGPPELIAPGFLPGVDVTRGVPTGAHGAERWLRRLAGIAFWLALTGTYLASEALSRLESSALEAAHQAGVLTDTEYEQRNATPEASSDGKTYGARYLARPDIVPFARGYQAQQRIAGIWVGGMMTASALWVLGGMFRSRPARILLLRRFNNVDVDEPLRRFAKRHLSPLGHVYTLADKHFRRPFFTWRNTVLTWSPTVWVPFLVLLPWDLVRGRLDWSSAGGRIKVRSARDFRRFAQRVADRVSSNTQMMASARRTIIVRTSDAWWQHVVRLLMLSADAIVVDLSDVAKGTEWELDTLVESRLLDRTLFVVRKDTEGAMDIARERLNLWWRHGALNRVVWNGLKSATAEARRAFERMGVQEGGIAYVVFDAWGRPLDEAQLNDALRTSVAGWCSRKMRNAPLIPGSSLKARDAASATMRTTWKVP